MTGLAAGGPRVAWAQAKDDAKRGGTLVVRSGPIRGIDPHLETWAATLMVVHQTYNALLKFNHDGTKILPDLAETWEQKDYHVLFKLRQGVKFHDVAPVNGRELTSEDVKYSIERQMTNQAGEVPARLLLPRQARQHRDAGQVHGRLQDQGAVRAVPELHREPVDGDRGREVVENTATSRHAVGTGPFIFQEWRRERSPSS